MGRRYIVIQLKECQRVGEEGWEGGGGGVGTSIRRRDSTNNTAFSTTFNSNYIREWERRGGKEG